MRTCGTVSLMGTLILVAGVGILRSDLGKEATAERIADLIRQLGDEDFDKREKASLALGKLGESALPELHKVAQTSGDPEVRLRARQLIDAFDNLPDRLRSAIKQVRDRQLLTTNSFWTIFHGILGNGIEMSLLNPETRQKVAAVEQISAGGPIRGLHFLPSRHGLDVQIGPPLVGQGHQDQFIAALAQWGMGINQPFLVNGKGYTFDAFVRHAQARATVNEDAHQELCWTLLVLAQYRGTDLKWTNERGEQLTFDDLVRHELKQRIDSAACGGMHRLFGLTWAYHLHLEKGGKKEGVWLDVIKQLDEQGKRARKFRNLDGSFSTKYLAGPGHTTDLQSRIETSGHVFEWLALVLPDSQLKEAWVVESADALVEMIASTSEQPFEASALYHAAHGLRIYYTRRYGKFPDAPELKIPQHPQSV